MIEPFKYSEWAALVVPFRKSDGSVQIFGDYKMTVKKVLHCGKYPVTKTEDLLATLNGDGKN